MIDMVCKECGDVFSVNKAREKTAKFCSTRDAEIHSRANIVAVSIQVGTFFRYRQWHHALR